MGKKDNLENKSEDKNKPCGDIFVHQAVIEKEGFRSLGLGEEVEFQAIRSDKGWEAVRVRGVDGKQILGMVREERRKKKARCFNCGHVGHHLALSCPQPPLPKRCHHCKSEAHLIGDCPALEQSKKKTKHKEEKETAIEKCNEAKEEKKDEKKST